MYVKIDIALILWRIYDGDFGFINTVNMEIMKIEGVRGICFKLHDGCTEIIDNVCYVSRYGENLISLRWLSSCGFTYFGQENSCKVFKGDINRGKLEI